MKTLIEPYLISKGLNEPFQVQFMRYTTTLSQDESGGYLLEFPVWRFPCARPQFTSQEIKDALDAELEEANNG